MTLLEFDLGRINETTALARQVSAAELTILSKIFSFTSEQQRLAYLDIFDPYLLFPGSAAGGEGVDEVAGPRKAG